MTISQATPDPVPWRDPPIPFYLRVIGYVAILLLFGLILCSAVFLLVGVYESILTSNLPLNEGVILVGLVLPVIGLFFGISGWKMLRRYAFGNYDFVPRNMVPPRILGEPFDIDMSRPISARGMLQFTKDGLNIQAKIEQGLIFSPDIGGLIIGLMIIGIGNLLHKRSTDYKLGYEQITEIKVTGRRVVLFSDDGKVKVTKVKVSTRDGERLYRELNVHFPGAIEQWRHVLR